MVRPGQIVAQGFGRVASEKHRARVLHLLKQGEGFVHVQLQVLGCDLVCDLERLVKVVDQNDLSVVFNGGIGDRKARQELYLPVDLLLHSFGERRTVRDEDGGGEHVVLGLGQQIRRRDAGIALPVGDHEHLARPRHHIDGHAAEDLPLRLSDVGVAGSDDLVHSRNALGPVGQGRHSLRSADLEHPVNPGDVRRREDCR